MLRRERHCCRVELTIAGDSPEFQYVIGERTIRADNGVVLLAPAARRLAWRHRDGFEGQLKFKALQLGESTTVDLPGVVQLEGSQTLKRVSVGMREIQLKSQNGFRFYPQKWACSCDLGG